MSQVPSSQDPSDPNPASRGEQPLYPATPEPPSATSSMPPPDSQSPPYTAPYPPYPYDPAPQAGISPNTAAGLAYFTVLPAILFLLLDPYRRNATLRFHSWQSIFYFVAFAFARVFEMLVVAMLPSSLAFFIGNLLLLVFFIGWLIAVIKAFQGSRYVLPVIGEFAEKTAQ